ncbi:MAG: M48 family metallopeptidase [Desulfatibacillaceae bacterium]
MQGKDRYNDLVRRLWNLAENRPGAYMARVFLLTLPGYAAVAAVPAAAFLLFVLAVLAAQSAGQAAALPLFILAGALLASTLVSLTMRPPAPDGFYLDARNVRELVEAVEDVRQRTGGPRIHAFVVSPEHNATVVQRTRFGPLGPARNHMVVGMPLLDSLSPEHFLAVVAHEMGHLDGRGGSFGARVYRLRLAWHGFASNLEKAGFISWPHRAFFTWYAPYFAAFTHVMARWQESEADQVAARYAGDRTAAQAITAMEVVGRYAVQRFWPRVFRDLAEGGQPAPLSTFAEEAPLSPDSDPVRELLEQAEKESPDLTDDHPSLVERVAKLGRKPEMPPVPGQTASMKYLGDTAGAIRESLDRSFTKAFSRGVRRS